MKNAIFCLFLLVSMQMVAQEYALMKWEDLIPKGLEFDDPFEELSEDQLYNLSYVYRTKLLVERRPQAVTQLTKSNLDSLEGLLRSQGVDIDYLFSIKDEMREKRERMYESVVTELDGKPIRLAGFLLPLAVADKAATEFLLVPYVGACIHEPIPPKNQLIYFKYPEGYEVKSLFDPVWVEGQLRIESKENELLLVDGSDNIESGYSMKVDNIEDYYKD